MNLADYAARVLAEMYIASGTPDPDPAPDARAVYADRQAAWLGEPPAGPPMRATAFEPGFRRDAAGEALVLESLAVRTAELGTSWGAALDLFTPNHGRT